MFIIITQNEDGFNDLLKGRAFKFPSSALTALHTACSYSSYPCVRSFIPKGKIWIAQTNCKDISTVLNPTGKGAEYMSNQLQEILDKWTYYDANGRDVIDIVKPLNQWLDGLKQDDKAKVTTRVTNSMRQWPSDPTDPKATTVTTVHTPLEPEPKAEPALPYPPEPAPMNPSDPFAGLTMAIEGVVKSQLNAAGINPEALKNRIETAAQQAINAARSEAEKAKAQAALIETESAKLLDEMRVKMASMKPIVAQHVIKIGNAEPIKLEPGQAVHKSFMKILETIKALRANGQGSKCNIMLVGPSGSGKTHLAGMLAEMLSLPFYAINGSEGIDEGHLTERFCPDVETGNWTRVKQVFANMVEHGGVFLTDEMDACDANVLVSMNAVLDNGILPMPNDPVKPTIKRHEDFIFIGTMNTFGTGANRLYTSRSPLDAATRNRFGGRTFMVNYDEALESMLTRDEELRLKLTAMRKLIVKNSLEQIISTRDLIISDTLCASGVIDHTEAADRLTMGWTEDERQMVGLPAENPLLS